MLHSVNNLAIVWNDFAVSHFSWAHVICTRVGCSQPQTEDGLKENQFWTHFKLCHNYWGLQNSKVWLVKLGLESLLAVFEKSPFRTIMILDASRFCSTMACRKGFRFTQKSLFVLQYSWSDISTMRNVINEVRHYGYLNSVPQFDWQEQYWNNRVSFKKSDRTSSVVLVFKPLTIFVGLCSCPYFMK